MFANDFHSHSGPNRGHYITIVKSHGLWLLFDDDIVEVSLFFDPLPGIQDKTVAFCLARVGLCYISLIIIITMNNGYEL